MTLPAGKVGRNHGKHDRPLLITPAVMAFRDRPRHAPRVVASGLRKFVCALLTGMLVIIFCVIIDMLAKLLDEAGGISLGLPTDDGSCTDPYSLTR